MPDSKDGLVGPGFSIVNDFDYPSIFITTFRNSIESGKDTQFNSNRYEDPIVTTTTSSRNYTFEPQPGISTSSIIDPDDYYELETGSARRHGYGKVLMPPSNQIHAGDRYGSAVAIGCGRLVVGSPEDMNAHNPIGSYGAIHIFKSTEEQDTDITNEFEWIKKVAGPQQVYGYYGQALAVGCGRIVVGSPGGNSLKGSIQILDLNGNLIKEVSPSDLSTQDEFGFSVAVGNNRIVAGARKQVGVSTTTYESNGAAYVFDLDGNQLFKLSPEEGGQYGYSVAVGSGRIVVGAPYWRYYNSNTQTNNDDAGKWFMYDLNGEFLRSSRTSSAYRYYGWAVAIADGTLYVSNLTGTVADPYGSSFIYDYGIGGVTAWKLYGEGGLIWRYSLSPTTYSTFSDGKNPPMETYQQYGRSLAAGNGTVVVGSPYWNDYSISLREYGAAFAYTQDSNSYHHHNRAGSDYNVPIWAASGWQIGGLYGSSVAVGNGTIAIGAPGHNWTDSTYGGAPGQYGSVDMGAVFCLSGIPARKYFLDQLDGK